MTLKRLVLALLTIIVVALVGNSLLGSLAEPQITSRLQLYQTDLLLHATELQSEEGSSLIPTDARKAILGEDPFGSALEQYESVRQSAQTNLEQIQKRLAQLTSNPASLAAASTPGSTQSIAPSKQEEQLQTAVRQQQDLISQLDLRIGILQAQQSKGAIALKSWAAVEQSQEVANPLVGAAEVLTGLWDNPPRLLPDAEPQIQQNLEGWFRYTALNRLYELQQRPDALTILQSAEQETAQQTLLKLALVGSVPLLGCLIGVGLLIFLVGQRWKRGKQSLLEQNAEITWETPWNLETVWQVLIVGFFFVGQIALPFILESLGISFTAFGSRAKATYALSYYLLMAGSGLLVLYLSLKPFFPLPEGWFRLKGGNWFLWGLGGYFVALPLMILVSLVNQQIWQGQGGSNPLLQIVLEEGDPISLGIFLFTAAIAAPIFEETLFRGFLLSSLTRYLPVWGAIAASSLLFAIAHLSFSEVLPLTVLGSVLGFVYTRSRNLLSSMLLHGLWNSATMIGLFILGSGMK